MGKEIARQYAEFQARLVQLARGLFEEMYPDGLPGGKAFSDIESAALAAGNEVTRSLIEDHIRAQAQSDPNEKSPTCPKCGGPLREGARQDRKLITTRGEITWIETTQQCPACRRAFSPSEPITGA